MLGPIALAPGTTFADDYRVVAPLAEGGMGAVYVVDQLSTGKRRALKVMHPQLLGDDKSRQRFTEEARVGSRIDSEHVVDVVAAGVDEATGIPWLAMELLDGQNLAQVVEARGPLPPAEALEVLEQAAHALGDAHGKGIVHRDLKPENLFLARSRRRGEGSVVKILDFGIARTAERSHTSATVTSAIGSPLWMAPEQATPGAKLRPATDVWALGLIAFYLLTGKSYWRAANEATFTLSALLVEVMTQDVVPASERARQLGAGPLPPGFDAWFLTSVARAQEARFADASAAVEALVPVLSGRGRAAAPADAAGVAVAPTATLEGPGPAQPAGHGAGERTGAATVQPAARAGGWSMGTWLLVVGVAGALLVVVAGGGLGAAMLLTPGAEPSAVAAEPGAGADPAA
ncbi:MAG: serine/threonine-protein kinase, partial [Sandaracinaceae bacterium]